MKRSYALCTTPRTGGTWLCEVLRDAGLGSPSEYPHWLAMDGELTASRYQALWAEEPFGVKLSPDMGTKIVPLHRTLPPGHQVWIFHTRDNKVAQARSFAIAQKYGCWFTPPPADAWVPDGLVAKARTRIEQFNLDWLAWFHQQRIVPLCTTYEEAVSDVAAVVARIRAALGLG